MEASEIDRRMLDRSIEGAGRLLLDASVGYSLDVAGAEGLRWMTDEPGASAFEGKIVVVQTWTRMTTRGRRAPQLAERILGDDLGEGVALVAVHTPEGAEGLERYLERRSPGYHVALDAEGGWLDFVGVYDEPTTIVLDRHGRVRVAGASITALPVIVEALVAEEATREEGETVEVEPMPTRAERVRAAVAGASDEGAGEAKADAEFPPISGSVGSARDVRGQRGPAIVAEQWLTDAPETEGKVVLLAWWATWCGPCIAGVPKMNGWHDEFEGTLEVVAISGEEDTGKVRRTVRERRMRYSVGVDTQRRSQRGDGGPQNRSIPHAVVMSPDGVVRWQGNPHGLSSAFLQRIVDASGAGMPASARELERELAERRWTEAEENGAGS